MATTGSCLCGKLTYSYTGEPAKKAVCHCLECQKLTGTAFTSNWLVPRENFTLNGTPKYNSFIQEIGVEVKYSFCGDCGTVIAKQSEADMFKPFYLVQAGTIATEPLVKEKPDVEFWVSRKASWLDEVKGAAQAQKFS